MRVVLFLSGKDLVVQITCDDHHKQLTHAVPYIWQPIWPQCIQHACTCVHCIQWTSSLVVSIVQIQRRNCDYNERLQITTIWFALILWTVKYPWTYATVHRFHGSWNQGKPYCIIVVICNLTIGFECDCAGKGSIVMIVYNVHTYMHVVYIVVRSVAKCRGPHGSIVCDDHHM